MSLRFRFLFAGLALLAGACAWAADPVAFLSDLKGEVTLDGVGKPPLLAELLPGSKLTLGAGATAVVMYVASGDEYSLKGAGSYAVGRDGVTASSGAAPSKRTPSLKPNSSIVIQVSKAAAASLRMRSAPGPRPDAAGPAYPVNAKVATLQPTLRWVADAAGASAYTIALNGADGKEVFRGPAKGTTLRLPVKLEPGRRYSWTCSSSDGTVLGGASFETLPLKSIQAADKARAAAREFPDRVLLALLLQELGAVQDGREVWAQLAAERPDLPEIAGLAH